MDLLDLVEIKNILNDAQYYVKSNNYYFHTHKCGDDEQLIKILMDYKIKNESSDKIIKLGYCDKCKTIFYHEDFESNSK